MIGEGEGRGRGLLLDSLCLDQILSADPCDDPDPIALT